MKKILALLLGVCMVFSLVACDTNEGTPQVDNEQGSTANGGDVTNVSTDGEVKLNNVIGDGSLTVTETENGFEVTVTHPKISMDFIEDGGHVSAYFLLENDEAFLDLFTALHDVDNSFNPRIHNYISSEQYGAEYVIEDGSMTWIGMTLPFDITTATEIQVAVGTEDSPYEYYLELYHMEDVLIPYDGKDAAIVNTIGNGSLTITEKFNSVDVMVTHPDITADFFENGNRVYVSFSSNDTKYEIRTNGSREEFFTTIDLLDENDYFRISHTVQDGSIEFTCLNAPFDITSEKIVSVQIGNDNDWGAIYDERFFMEDVLIPYAGATLLEGGSPQSEDEIVLDNVIGDVSLTVKEQYDSYHVTITHPSYMVEFLEGQIVPFDVYLRKDNSESYHVLGLGYSSANPGQITSNYVSFSGVVGTTGQAKPLTYTIDEKSLTWYLPKSYGLDMDSIHNFTPVIANYTINPNGDNGYQESFLKSNCYIPYNDSMLQNANLEALAIFDGHWTLADNLESKPGQSIDNFMVDATNGTWTAYNDFAFYRDSLPCYANDGNLTMLLSLVGEMTLAEQNGNLVDNEGNVQYVKSEPIDQNDILQEVLGEWVFNPDISPSTLILTEDECQEFSSRGELIYTGSWELVETEIVYSDGSVVYNPVIRLDLGDYNLSGDYAIFDTKALIHLSDTYSSNYIIHESQADENLKLMNMLKAATTGWYGFYEDEIATYNCYLTFDRKIDRLVTLNKTGNMAADGRHFSNTTVEGTWEFIEDDVLRITFSDGTYEDIPFDGTSLDIEHYGLTFE